ncbi:hypothetical protein Mapa_003787 [Marchantia paleacea]|nr:hypothetical protein Mapa_003787 [Marchantia paleacea]
MMTKEKKNGISSMAAQMQVSAMQMPLLRAMPKLELHAHLNGCVRTSTLLDLAIGENSKDKVSNSDLECLIRKEDRSLTECFRLFPVIHALTTDHAVVTRITKEAIEDFLLDNVVYLELRTTPKCNDLYGMSKRSYVEAVFAGFEAAGVMYKTDCDVQDGHRMHVRLLLSIDRRENAEAAMNTVQLAWDMRDRGVAGVDLSGDPAIGNWETFLPALTWAKELGVPLTLHCGEVSNPKEVRAMLALQPSRLGHVCCLEEAEWRALLDSGIPVEICLTSNIRTESVSSMRDHHFAALYNAKHPVVLCTDDPGLFSTSLTLEFAIAATCFGLTNLELLIMGKSAINYTFADDKTKLILHEIFDDALQ